MSSPSSQWLSELTKDALLYIIAYTCFTINLCLYSDVKIQSNLIISLKKSKRALMVLVENDMLTQWRTEYTTTSPCVLVSCQCTQCRVLCSLIIYIWFSRDGFLCDLSRATHNGHLTHRSAHSRMIFNSHLEASLAAHLATLALCSVGLVGISWWKENFEQLWSQKGDKKVWNNCNTALAMLLLCPLLGYIKFHFHELQHMSLLRKR